MSGSITITSVLRRTAQAYRAQAVLILSASLAVVVVVGGIESLPIGNPYARLATALVSLMAVALFVGVVVQIVAEARERQSKAEFRQAIRTATSATGELALVLIVASILIVLLLLAASFLYSAFVIAAILGISTFRHHIVPGVGFVLVVILFYLPCIYLVVSWSLAAPVVLLERPGGLRALGRSRALVRKNRWRVLAALLLLGILVGGSDWAIESVGAAVGHDTATILRLLVTILTAPIPVVVTAVLYFELLEPASQAATWA